jgi:hypothetical protein
VSGLHVADHHHIPNEKHLRKERGNSHRHTHKIPVGSFVLRTALFIVIFVINNIVTSSPPHTASLLATHTQQQQHTQTN